MKNPRFKYYFFAATILLLLLFTALPSLIFKEHVESVFRLPILKESSFFSFFVLFFLNLTFYLGYKKLLIRNLSLKQIIFPAILFNIVALCVLPLVSDDLYTYFYRARIWLEYGANPYFNPYSNYTFDVYYSTINNVWSGYTAIYGPFFWLVISSLISLVQAKLFTSVYLIKALFSVSFFASAVVIYKLTKSKLALFLFSWNPYLIFFGVLDGHSDILILALTLLSIYFAILIKKNPRKVLLTLVSWGLFVSAVLIKIYILPLSVFVLYLIVKNLKLNPRRILPTLLLLGFQSFFLICVIYLPFWKGGETVGRYQEIFRGYESGSYFLGAFPVSNELFLSKLVNLLYLLLRIAYIAGYLIISWKIMKAVLLGKPFKTPFFFMALSILAFILIFIRVWNPWYFIIPTGLFTMSLKEKKLSKNFIFVLAVLGIVYTILL